MKRVTKSRINAIHNAGSFLDALDGDSGLSDKELYEHHNIGRLLIDNAEQVLKLLIQIHNNEQH